MRVEPTRGDVLSLPAAFWARNEVWRAAAAIELGLCDVVVCAVIGMGVAIALR